jgi:hypothetical protein
MKRFTLRVYRVKAFVLIWLTHWSVTLREVQADGVGAYEA